MTINIKVLLILCRKRFSLGLIGSFIVASFTVSPLLAQSTESRLLVPLTEKELGRKSRNQYGSLESTIQALRANRPLDLSVEVWKKANPEGSHSEWAEQARECLASGLHYDAGPVDLKAETLERIETDSFIREKIEFNTAPWFRVPGYFYTPKNVSLPAPALVMFHEWGGPMFFGADRICGEPVHPILREHREKYTSGRAIADWFASKGYAVIVIDAYHFGSRAPRGIYGLPDSIDPVKLDEATLKKYQSLAKQSLYLGVRQLNWAGTTWAGVNYGDDSRCIDYLLTRKEVDANRIGCTGLSGGGWRTNMLAALEPRIKAAVSVGWMSTGDAQQAYNVVGSIGTFCLLPGVWDRMDVPDLISMAAPKACMVVSSSEDLLFPPKGQQDAARKIAQDYTWAGCVDKFKSFMPSKPHCYDAEIQQAALDWFDHYLKK